MSCVTCALTTVSIFLKDVVGLELRVTSSSFARCVPYQRKRRSCIQSTSSFHQSSRRFLSALAPARVQRPDDLYIPFEQSVLGDKAAPLKARGSAAIDNTLPWGVFSNTQPPDPKLDSSGTTTDEYRRSFDPDIQLREEFYRGAEDQPFPRHFSSRRNDVAPGGLEIRNRTAQPRSDIDNQEGAVMSLGSQNADAVVDVLGRLPSKVIGMPSVRLPVSQERRDQKAGAPHSGSDSKKKHRLSKQTRPIKTAGVYNAAWHKREPWQAQKHALREKFGQQGWSPRKRLSPDALEGIRALHAQYPEKFTTPVLADQFKVSPEAIRRILRSKWRPDETEEISRKQRWDKRGESIWRQMVELGVKPPKRWREMGITKKDNVHGPDRSTRGHHGSGTGKWNATNKSRSGGAADQSSQLEPEEFLEERIL